MSSYPYLPGTQLFQTDGGLNNPLVPRSKRTLVLGTAAKGPTVAYQLTQRSQAALDYGLDGTLIHDHFQLQHQSACSVG